MACTSRIALLILNGLVATIGVTGRAAAQPPARAISQLKSVLVRPGAGSIQVIFRVGGPVRYKASRSTDPPRIVIDFSRTGISPVFTKREILSVHAALVRVLITRGSGSTRAVLDLASAGAHTVYATSDELIVEIKTAVPAGNTRTEAAPLAGRPLEGPASALVPDVTPQTQDFSLVESGDALKIPWVPLGPTIEDYTSS